MGNVAVTSPDEVGELTQAFNTMQDNLRQLIKEMVGISEQMATSTEKLTTYDEQIAASSQELSHLADNMQTAIKKFKLS